MILNKRKYLQEELNKIKQRNYEVEKEFMKMYKVMEYKYCQHNIALNKILYDNEFIIHKNSFNEKFNPLVSIIIPVYNGSNYLEYAIKSALNQTYKNIEIIVVNDGSDDNGKTKKIAEKFKSKIRYYEKENGGVSTALNYGIKKMKGEYFAWLSHDDLIYPNHIYEHVKYLSYFNDDKTITYTNFDLIDENGEILLNDTIIALIHISDYKLTRTSHFGCILQGEVNGGSVMIPKKAFKKHGLFNESERITQEKDMWSRLLKDYTFINIPYITSSIRNHSNQVTNKSNNILIETRRKILEIIDNIPDKDKIKESGSLSKFYLELYKHYENNNLIDLANDMYKKYKEEGEK